MSEIKVTAQQLKNIAEQLKGLNGQFQSEIDSLVSKEQILASNWEGESCDTHKAAFNSDKAQWDNFHTLIEQYCVALENIAIRYENAEAKAQGIAAARNY